MTTRILTGAALLALLLIALYFGGWLFSILWIAALCVAMYELFSAFKLAGHRPVSWPNWLAMGISIPVFLLIPGKNGVALLFLIMFVSCLLVSFCVIFRDGARLEDLLVSELPLFTVVLPGLCLLGLLRADPIAEQRMLLSLSFFVPVVGDAGAYFVGVKYGKHQLSKVVSPKKTVEGAAAGLLFSTLTSVIIYLIGSACMSPVHKLWTFMLVGFLGGLAGQIGDLFASLIKRHCGLKDYGHIFPGHGGMMDRLDSVLFVSILVYMYYLLSI